MFEDGFQNAAGFYVLVIRVLDQEVMGYGDRLMMQGTQRFKPADKRGAQTALYREFDEHHIHDIIVRVLLKDLLSLIVQYTVALIIADVVIVEGSDFADVSRQTDCGEIQIDRTLLYGIGLEAQMVRDCGYS